MKNHKMQYSVSRYRNFDAGGCHPTMATTILSLHFRVLSLLGVWCPLEWSTSYKRYIYHAFTLLIASCFIFLNSCQLAKLFFGNIKKLSEFIGFLMMWLTLEAAAVKSATYLVKRAKLEKLISMFEADICVARDDYERNLRKVCERNCKWIAKGFYLYYEFSLYSFMTTPLSYDSSLRILFYPALLPYSLESALAYWVTYAYEVFTLFFLAHAGLVSDFTSMGFMYHLSTQYKVLKHRLHKLPGLVAEFGQPATEKKAIKQEIELFRDCIEFHLHLHNIGQLITEVYSICIVFEVYLDALAICMGVYQLSTLSYGYYGMFSKFLYVVGMLIRLFRNCYFGNEVATQSESIASEIYLIDWTPLSLELRKNLCLMMLCASKPIMVCNKAFIQLMVEFFVKVVKISYSGYNLLASTVH